MVQEFANRVDQLYGLYLDSTMGFDSNVRTIERAQSSTGAADDSAFFISDGAPNDPDNVLLHQTTQGEFKKRNSPASFGGAPRSGGIQTRSRGVSEPSIVEASVEAS
jgi:hypothetical protein